MKEKAAVEKWMMKTSYVPFYEAAAEWYPQTTLKEHFKRLKPLQTLTDAHAGRYQQMKSYLGAPRAEPGVFPDSPAEQGPSDTREMSLCCLQDACRL